MSLVIADTIKRWLYWQW